jgi:hypothetical protein
VLYPDELRADVLLDGIGLDLNGWPFVGYAATGNCG